MILAKPAVPPSDVEGCLPGSDYIDSYCVTTMPGLDPVGAARLIFDHPPRWIVQLSKLRDAIVVPFGLKSTKPNPSTIGIFPIQSITADRVVMGMDDTHLDFRVVVHVDGPMVTVTTLVRYRTAFGNFYMSAIKPAHRLIARTMVGRIAK